jgi:predicted small lipoprotein YifL
MPALPARALAVAAALTLLAACGGSGTASQPPATKTVTTTASAAASSSPAATSSASATPPGIVAVTAAGALVTLSPTTGAVFKTLAPAHAVGDEIAVAANGTVYFTEQHGCRQQIYAVPVSGMGSPAPITSGSLPALTPDGSKIAFVRQPAPTENCFPTTPNLVPLYKLYVRTFTTGAQQVFPMVPASQDNRSLPAPITHLSWGPDGVHLAVSVSPIQDNEGWNLALVDTATAHYYLSGTGISYVPVTGQPTPQRSYLREGVYLPDGDLFVSRACCGGVPVKNTSRLMWEVTPAGALVHQVAIGYPALDHTSLDASARGGWLVYLAGQDLYVSAGGATPHEVTKGLLAAAWEP